MIDEEGMTIIIPLEGVLEPDQLGDGYWVGSGNVFYDRGKGKYYLVHRRRDPDNRGYAIEIYESTDGVDFTLLKTINKGDVNSNSLECPKLIKDPVTGKYYLFFSTEDATNARWEIHQYESEDLVNWSKVGVVAYTGEEGTHDLSLIHI